MIDNFTIRHVSGACDTVLFYPNYNSWADRRRIVIVSGERIRVTLYGNGADFAQNATGSGIYEWISDRGTSTDNPAAGYALGRTVPIGYVAVDIRAARSHGLGNRTVRVNWATGSELLNLRIVASCAEAERSRYRYIPRASTSPSSGIIIRVPPVPNLLPHVNTPYVLARAYGPEVPTPNGGMFRVDDYFGKSLQPNIITTVPVPDLTWGVIGDRIGAANTQIDVQLFDESDFNNPRVLGTLNLPQGFPPNTPLVTTNNYPGRPVSIRVVKNPTFQFDDGRQTFCGTFTEPGNNQALEPSALLLVADSSNQINEGVREADNELRF